MLRLTHWWRSDNNLKPWIYEHELKKLLKKLESELIDGMMFVFGLWRVCDVFSQDAVIVDMRSQTYVCVSSITSSSTQKISLKGFTKMFIIVRLLYDNIK